MTKTFLYVQRCDVFTVYAVGIMHTVNMYVVGGHFKHTGLYGNDDLHNGLLEVLSSGRKVDKIISSVRNQTQILESTLANKIRPQLVELADIFDQPASNQTALSQLILSLNIVQGNVTTAKNAAADIRRPLMQVTISQFLSVSFTLATTV